MGRPSLYTPELIEAICDRLSEGEPLAQICRDQGMPDPRTVRDWQNSMPDVSAAIARAREAGEERMLSDCLEIAEEREGKAIMADGAEVAVVFDSNAIQRNKLRIDTRLKLLAKFNPKRYGDRVQHANDPDNPLVPAQASDAELDARIRALMGKES